MKNKKRGRPDGLAPTPSPSSPTGMAAAGIKTYQGFRPDPGLAKADWLNQP
jgi:hypothetical protein